VKKSGIIFGIVGLVVVVCLGAYLLLAQPKLEANLLGTGLDKKVVVITLGNEGIQEIQLLHILFNNSNTPKNVKVQLNESGKGFALSESLADEGYIFKNYDEINIETDTAEKDINYDSLYGLWIKDDEEIKSVTIQYKYLGKEFEKTVTVF
jgi:hypothetical protein